MADEFLWKTDGAIRRYKQKFVVRKIFWHQSNDTSTKAIGCQILIDWLVIVERCITKHLVSCLITAVILHHLSILALFTACPPRSSKINDNCSFLWRNNCFIFYKCSVTSLISLFEFNTLLNLKIVFFIPSNDFSILSLRLIIRQDRPSD